MPTIQEAVALALQHHQAGRLNAAENVYRQILAQLPQHVPTLQLLGVLSSQQGKHAQAVQLIRQAIDLTPDNAGFHSNLGEAERRSGNLNAAIAAFQRAIELQPIYPEAYNNLGNVLREAGRWEESATAIRQALSQRENYPEAHCNLGATLSVQGDHEQAIAEIRQALTLNPNQFEAFLELSNAYTRAGKPAEAIMASRQAIALRPGDPQAFFSLGNALLAQDDSAAAAEAFRQVVLSEPNFVEAYLNLGIAQKNCGELDQAISSFRRALEIRPDFTEGAINLTLALRSKGAWEEVIAVCQQLIARQPDCAEAYCRLGSALRSQGKLDEAVVACQDAIARDPTLLESFLTLGNVLKDQGRMDEAVASYRRALELEPQDRIARSNLLLALQYVPEIPPDALAAEFREFDRYHVQPLAPLTPVITAERKSRARLRIGYVSPDLHSHPVGRFMWPLYEAHQHVDFEIFSYASVSTPDWVTTKCRANSDQWRDVLGWSDERVARLIREDQIDILVDLSMHTSQNRLLVFARKPAPVQVAYLAYCGTTGLTSIDYRLTDPYLEPLGGPAIYSSEVAWHLPETFWCFQPLGQMPPVEASPVLAAGHITFGCLNNFCKVSPGTLQAWMKLLQMVPNSQLILHAHPGRHRDRLLEQLKQRGIAPARVEIVGKVSADEYFRTYHRIDVALDPFPYGGGTTTCDALWMGVPVVSLAGKTPAGRGGLSILSNIGLAELVGQSEDDYIRIAAELANALPRLTDLRGHMRERMQTSPLMDAPRFAKNIEAAYREMWRRYCEQHR